MRNWPVLAIAISSEVFATLSLRAAVDGGWWLAGAIGGYVTAFVALSMLVRKGAPIGVVYGIWAAAGVSLTAVLAAIVFGEALTLPIIVGIAVVIIGVVLVETGHRSTAKESEA